MIYGVTAETEPAHIPSAVPNTYVASAVHFDGSTYLRRSAGLTGFGTPSKFTAVGWFKLSACGDGYFGDAFNYFILSSTFNAGIPYIAMNVADSYFDAVGNQPTTSATWKCFMQSADISNSPTSSPFFLYSNDTNVMNLGDKSAGSTHTIGNNNDFWFGNDAFGTIITGDVADFRLWFGQAVDFSLTANRRLFLDGSAKPIDPATANTALGTPIVSFVGNTAAFPVNGGSGGSFTLTGSLSAASTSPSD